MLRVKMTGDWESRGQLSNPGLHGQWPLNSINDYLAEFLTMLAVCAGFALRVLREVSGISMFKSEAVLCGTVCFVARRSDELCCHWWQKCNWLLTVYLTSLTHARNSATNQFQKSSPISGAFISFRYASGRKFLVLKISVGEKDM